MFDEDFLNLPMSQLSSRTKSDSLSASEHRTHPEELPQSHPEGLCALSTCMEADGAGGACVQVPWGCSQPWRAARGLSVLCSEEKSDVPQGEWVWAPKGTAPQGWGSPGQGACSSALWASLNKGHRLWRGMAGNRGGHREGQGRFCVPEGG